MESISYKIRCFNKENVTDNRSVPNKTTRERHFVLKKALPFFKLCNLLKATALPFLVPFRIQTLLKSDSTFFHVQQVRLSLLVNAFFCLFVLTWQLWILNDRKSLSAGIT